MNIDEIIFKPVISSINIVIPILGIATRNYVEQSTLVHEFGHALGLVNNGVSITTTHHDSANELTTLIQLV